MEIALKIMGGALGLLVPYLFLVIFNEGISNGPFERSVAAALKTKLIIFVAMWVTLIWVLSLTGVLSYHSGDVFPRFVVALIAPVMVGLLLIKKSEFKMILDNIPLSMMVGVQTFRLAGFAFLLVVNLNILPKAFAIGGYGDIITGILAMAASIALSRGIGNGRFLFWAFNVAGLVDLLNVAIMLLVYYPIWSQAQPSSAAATGFSLVMIPAVAAPIALLLHIYSIRNYMLLSPGTSDKNLKIRTSK